MKDSLRILALEPYDGGSHRAFLDGWSRHSRHRWTRLGLPPRHWKWRMRQAPFVLAGQAAARSQAGERWDAIVCSEMLNLAEWRGLVPPDLAGLPAVVYFHENQLTYPVRKEDERDQHFGMTHIGTLLACQAAWFNSDFHRESFLEALPRFLAAMPERAPPSWLDTARSKSRTVYPAVEPLVSDPGARSPSAPLHIVWAARWEHDKDPWTLFEALNALHRRGVEFRLSVVGPPTPRPPSIFARARHALADHIVHWGPHPDRSAYGSVLQQADVAVSTAQHEFFGFGMVEAVLAGARPLVPRRLAYPEVWDADPHPERFYDGSADGLARALEKLALRDRTGDAWERHRNSARERAREFTWPARVAPLDGAVQKALGGRFFES